MTASMIDCSRCGRHARRYGLLFGQPACGTCIMRVRRDPRACPGCGGIKVIAFLDHAGLACCATCAGQPARYACSVCGSEEQAYGRLCAPCRLRERATVLLTGPDGGIHPQLQPVFEALTAVDRAQTVLWWFHHSRGPELLHRMALGQVPITHAAFADLPADRTHNYIRDLLVAVGVLEPYDAQLERMVPWLNQRLTTLPPEHADVLARFARWQVMRRLRLVSAQGKLTRSGMQNGRSTINTTIRLLRWLYAHDLPLEGLSQSDLDRYLTEYPRTMAATAEFIAWTGRQHLTTGLTTPRPQRSQPEVTLSDDQRWAQVELLLHDESIRLYARVAGLLTLLFAQPLSRVVRMRAAQIATTGEAVTVTFDTVPVTLPEPLDALVLRQLATRGLSSYVSRPDPWLFPGGIPARHLVTECVRAELVANGIHPKQARMAALFQLAGQLPTPVLAELLALGNNTAARWSALAAKDWSSYTAQRAN